MMEFEPNDILEGNIGFRYIFNYLLFYDLIVKYTYNDYVILHNIERKKLNIIEKLFYSKKYKNEKIGFHKNYFKLKSKFPFKVGDLVVAINKEAYSFKGDTQEISNIIPVFNDFGMLGFFKLHFSNYDKSYWYYSTNFKLYNPIIITKEEDYYKWLADRNK